MSTRERIIDENTQPDPEPKKRRIYVPHTLTLGGSNVYKIMTSLCGLFNSVLSDTEDIEEAQHQIIRILFPGCASFGGNKWTRLGNELEAEMYNSSFLQNDFFSDYDLVHNEDRNETNTITLNYNDEEYTINIGSTPDFILFDKEKKVPVGIVELKTTQDFKKSSVGDHSHKYQLLYYISNTQGTEQEEHHELLYMIHGSGMKEFRTVRHVYDNSRKSITKEYLRHELYSHVMELIKVLFNGNPPEQQIAFDDLKVHFRSFAWYKFELLKLCFKPEIEPPEHWQMDDFPEIEKILRRECYPLPPPEERPSGSPCIPDCTGKDLK